MKEKNIPGENLYNERSLLVFPIAGIATEASAEATPVVASLLPLLRPMSWAPPSSSSSASSSGKDGVAPASGLREPALPEVFDSPAPTFLLAACDKPSYESLMIT
ncbi:hypothetical protein Hanom_Chr17g01538771 [Helianthus anomalus]